MEQGEEVNNNSSSFQIIMNTLLKNNNKNYLCTIASNKTRDFIIILVQQSSYLYAYQLDINFFEKINFFKNILEKGFDKCIDLLISLFTNKKDITLEEEECKTLKLSLEIELNIFGTNLKLGKEKIEFILQYDDVEQKIKSELIWLSSLFLLQEREINQKTIDELNTQISDLKNLIEELKKKIINKNNFYTNNNSSIIYDDLNKSQIINKSNINNFNFVKKKIKNIYKKNNIDFKMLYDAKKNGDKSHIFHELCDNNSNTLVLVNTQTNMIFGGFASKKWNSLELGRKKDDKSFLFSINQQKIYNPKKDKYHLYCSENEGPCFYAFSIEDSFLEKGGSCDETNKCNYETFEKDYELNNGDHHFSIKQLEIYKILFHD